MSHLVGVSGTERIVQLLSTSADPKRTILGFQQENGLQEVRVCSAASFSVACFLFSLRQNQWLTRRRAMPPQRALDPLLLLLDLHSVPRREVHTGLLEDLRQEFIGRLDKLSSEELTKLLERVFPYIAQPGLTDAAMAVLSKHPALPTPYLKALKRAPQLLATCPLLVRRQVSRRSAVWSRAA